MTSPEKVRINSIQGIAKIAGELLREDKTGSRSERVPLLASPPRLQPADRGVARNSGRDPEKLAR